MSQPPVDPIKLLGLVAQCAQEAHIEFEAAYRFWMAVLAGVQSLQQQSTASARTTSARSTAVQ